MGFSVKEVIETARYVTGKPIKEIISDRRPGDPAVLVASSDKIQKELNWYPKYNSIETIIESAWKCVPLTRTDIKNKFLLDMPETLCYNDIRHF